MTVAFITFGVAVVVLGFIAYVSIKEHRNR